MAIVATDIKFYHSGGASNSDPNASLGGVVSSVEITDNTLHNLFDKVSGDESSAGDTEYRAFFVKNNHGTLTLENAYAWVLTNTPGGDSVEIGKEASSGSSKQTIGNESTAPSSPTITFAACATKGAGLSLGNLAPGVVYMIWVKRIVPASCAVYDNNYFEIKVEGDTAA
jgi:hypothetical protein